MLHIIYRYTHTFRIKTSKVMTNKKFRSGYHWGKNTTDQGGIHTGSISELQFLRGKTI